MSSVLGRSLLLGRGSLLPGLLSFLAGVSFLELWVAALPATTHRIACSNRLLLLCGFVRKLLLTDRFVRIE